MCKWNKWGKTRIDPCMRYCITTLVAMSVTSNIKVVACCCGHNKYPRTIVVENSAKDHWELLSGKMIERKKKFYKRDKQGYYFIPEVLAGGIKSKEKI